MSIEDNACLTIVKNGYTPLHIAAFYGNLKVCSFLIEKGSSVHEIIQVCRVQLLNRYFCDKRTMPQDGSTPLHTAASGGYTSICRLLIDRGAKFDQENQVKSI